MAKLHDQIVSSLEKRGSHVVQGRSKKYTTMTHPRSPALHYFVGHHGALRVGHTVASSVSISAKKLLVSGK